AHDRIVRRPAFEARVPMAKNDALQTAVTWNEIELRREERPVVFAGNRGEQVDAGQIAFAAHGGIQTAGAADGKKLRAHALPVEFSEQIIESDAVAADDDEIGQLQIAAEK